MSEKATLMEKFEFELFDKLYPFANYPGLKGWDFPTFKAAVEKVLRSMEISW